MLILPADILALLSVDENPSDSEDLDVTDFEILADDRRNMQRSKPHKILHESIEPRPQILHI